MGGRRVRLSAGELLRLVESAAGAKGGLEEGPLDSAKELATMVGRDAAGRLKRGAGAVADAVRGSVGGDEHWHRQVTTGDDAADWGEDAAAIMSKRLNLERRHPLRGGSPPPTKYWTQEWYDWAKENLEYLLGELDGPWMDAPPGSPLRKAIEAEIDRVESGLDRIRRDPRSVWSQEAVSAWVRSMGIKNAPYFSAAD
jgi:hypothetical protein